MFVKSQYLFKKSKKIPDQRSHWRWWDVFRGKWQRFQPWPLDRWCWKIQGSPTGHLNGWKWPNMTLNVKTGLCSYVAMTMLECAFVSGVAPYHSTCRRWWQNRKKRQLFERGSTWETSSSALFQAGTGQKSQQGSDGHLRMDEVSA